MSVIVVVGAQWGDEGKGKVVDYITESAELVVRFQGGNNAGHTVVVDDERFALRLLPSGILRSNVRCLLASGVVIDPHAFLEEVDDLEKNGRSVDGKRLGIAGEAQLILPYHKAIDREREEGLADGKIGTTGKGIGPAYEGAVSRVGIRIIDLFDKPRLKELVKRNVTERNKYLQEVLGSKDQFDADEILAELESVAERLEPFVCNVSVEVTTAAKAGKNVVFEGAQGTLLDISHGTYPFVTSSHTVAGYAPVSAGVGPSTIDYILGIVKAYTTRVGSGPFPTEDSGDLGDRLRRVGGEFGTVTSRPRRCGWFDVVAVKRAVRLNGITSLLYTKLDVLSGLKSIPVAVSYRLDGKEIFDLPPRADQLSRVEVEYQELEGWDEDITGVRTFGDLPVAAQAYLKKLTDLVECDLGGFSVGPGREQTVMSDSFLSFWT